MQKEQLYRLIEDHFRQHQKTQVTKLSRYLGNRANAEDVVQETYCRACTYWNTYESDQDFDTWMYVLLQNVIKDSFRTAYLNGMGTDQEIVYAGDAVKRLQLKELGVIIDEHPSNVKRILILALVEGYTAKEVAEIVTETAHNIRKIIQRFRENYK